MSLEMDDGEEIDSLDAEINQLIRSSSSPPSSPKRPSPHGAHSHHRRPSFKLMCSLLVLSILACHWVAPIILPDVIRKASSLNGLSADSVATDSVDEENDESSSKPPMSATKEEDYLIKMYDSRLDITCPAFDENSVAAHLKQLTTSDQQQPITWYDSRSKEISSNVSEYLRIFQKLQGFDSWGHSYDDVQRGMRHFRQKYLIPNVSDNMSIYESSCGKGLNLYMTIDLLQQEGFRGLVIYGSDENADAVRVANQLLDSSILPGRVTFGLVCQADPTSIPHIPDNSMDIVISGGIDPLANPLGLDVGSSSELYGKYVELCEAKKDVDPDNYALSDDAQHKQNAWYRTQLDEMIRIAKPGAPIILEHVSYPLCESLYDGGGIYQSFFKSNIDLHDWNIDANSIAFEEDFVFRHRYHAFMRKNQ
ncbi:hypothetical protein MPSEU_000631400 [Mayamaea pseudoterrestris]|nr:hypothetical protein MPSEU_000631400 [Mayamaea pseudoterrestris]